MDAWIRAGKKALVLAPMEGVTDAPMRALMTESGAFTHCVSEFLRISQAPVQPAKSFLSHADELNHGSRTPSGVPVIFQVLGGCPEKLAQAASVAASLGALGIDLNFGCPAPTVNRNDGGATLLKFPHRIYEIVSHVRKAVPPHLPVSAKLRLGWDNINDIYVNAEQAIKGGADWLTIHGRTRVQGYTPPAYWGPIGELKRQHHVPIIANGEIWTLDDFKRCQDETRCDHFMIGRGALANPYLPLQIARELGISTKEEALFPDMLAWRKLLLRLQDLADDHVDNSQYIVCRWKQWLKMAHLKTPLPTFDLIKKTKTVDEFLAAL